jgi:DNA invertase Pin-like site-specific DNA recombinase
LHDRQIPLTIVTQPELGASAEHSLLLNLMASFAEFEQEMTRERLADALAVASRSLPRRSSNL